MKFSEVEPSKLMQPAKLMKPAKPSLIRLWLRRVRKFLVTLRKFVVVQGFILLFCFAIQSLLAFIEILSGWADRKLNFTNWFVLTLVLTASMYIFMSFWLHLADRHSFKRWVTTAGMRVLTKLGLRKRII